MQRPGAAPHVTVVWHSHGSLVLGTALREEGLSVGDDAADDLGRGFDRLWAGRAAWDVVGNAPFHGEDPA